MCMCFMSFGFSYSLYMLLLIGKTLKLRMRLDWFIVDPGLLGEIFYSPLCLLQSFLANEKSVIIYVASC